MALVVGDVSGLVGVASAHLQRQGSGGQGATHPRLGGRPSWPLAGWKPALLEPSTGSDSTALEGRKGKKKEKRFEEHVSSPFYCLWVFACQDSLFFLREKF